MHWGYGFPIGGVAATDVDAGGVVSPGGVGSLVSRRALERGLTQLGSLGSGNHFLEVQAVDTVYDDEVDGGVRHRGTRSPTRLRTREVARGRRVGT